MPVAPDSGQIRLEPGLRADLPSRSLRDLRDQHVVRQRFDFSCGAAALATILRYAFGDDVTERQVLQQLFDGLSGEELASVRRTGFSLLHLQRVAQARGYVAEGFRLQPAQVPMLGGPVIVFIEPRGYKHFAVLRGLRAGRAYLADPARGNVRAPLHTFLDDWLQDDGTGVVFVVEAGAGRPAVANLLRLPSRGLPPPEIMTARELLAVGSALTELAIR